MTFPKHNQEEAQPRIPKPNIKQTKHQQKAILRQILSQIVTKQGRFHMTHTYES